VQAQRGKFTHDQLGVISGKRIERVGVILLFVRK
jgi:hypothetical protein